MRLISARSEIQNNRTLINLFEAQVIEEEGLSARFWYLIIEINAC